MGASLHWVLPLHAMDTDVMTAWETGRAPGIAIELGTYGQGRARQLAVTGNGAACIALSDGRLAVHDGVGWHEVAMQGRLSAPTLHTGSDGHVLVTEGTSTLRVEPATDGRWRLTPLPDGTADHETGAPHAEGHDLPAAAKSAAPGLATDIRVLGRTPDEDLIALLNRRRQVALIRPDEPLRFSIEPEPDGPAQAIQSACVDLGGRVWVLTRDRLHRFEPDLPATLFVGRDRPGRGVVRSIVRHQGRLHVATSDGVHRLEPAGGNRGARFEPLDGMKGNYWSLLAGEGRLLAGGSRGLEQRSDQAAPPAPLPPGDIFALTPAHNHRDLFFVGSHDAVSAVRLDPGEIKLLESRTLAVSSLSSLVESEPGTLWVASANGEVVRLTLVESPDHAALLATRPPPPRVETSATTGRQLPLVRLQPNARRSDSPLIGVIITHYGPADGLSHDPEPLRVLVDGAGLQLVSSQGLLLFDQAQNRFQPRFTPAATDRIIHAGVGLAGIWLVVRQDGELRLGRLAPDVAAPDWLDLPPALLGSAGAITALMEERVGDRHVLWLGGTEGMVRLDLDRPWPQTSPPAVRVHAVDATGSFRVAVPLAPPFQSWRILTRLRGHGEWSDAADGSLRVHPGLSPGGYIFETRAVDDRGRSGPVTAAAFVIAPPWWRTPGVMLSGAGLGALGIVGLVRFRIRRLRRANEQLEAVVRQRTAELQNNEAQLRVAKDEAEAASRAKSVFLASMSHELRTPLNAVLGYTQVMLRDTALPGEHRRRLGAIAHGGEHLLRMINEILDLSKIEAGKIELQPRPAVLPRLLAGITEMFQLRAGQQGVAFSHRQTTPLPESVLADEGRLRQVLINLLDNAMKFTPAGGRVELETGREGGRIRFTVRDTGGGIPPEQLGRIFLPFHQASDPDRRQQGAGLGLAISQRLIGLMGGTIHAESTPGRGSSFSFAITVPEADPGATAETAPIRRTGYHGPRRRVLVVDDEETNRRVLHDMLDPLGLVVTEAADGLTAVEAVRAQMPDLILMDVRMPNLDGLAAVAQIRRLPGGRGVRIVAVSASVFSSDHAEAIARGCDDFLPKPFREAQLLGVIGRLLQLDWIEEPVRETPVPGDESRRPPQTELEALAALAADGNVTALRRRLADLRERHPDCTPWLGRLDALAARFQMTRLSHEIAGPTDENAAAR